jgi:hypothetical protein
VGKVGRWVRLASELVARFQERPRNTRVYRGFVQRLSPPIIGCYATISDGNCRHDSDGAVITSCTAAGQSRENVLCCPVSLY